MQAVATLQTTFPCKNRGLILDSLTLKMYLPSIVRNQSEGLYKGKKWKGGEAQSCVKLERKRRVCN